MTKIDLYNGTYAAARAAGASPLAAADIASDATEHGLPYEQEEALAALAALRELEESMRSGAYAPPRALEETQLQEAARCIARARELDAAGCHHEAASYREQAHACVLNEHGATGMPIPLAWAFARLPIEAWLAEERA